MKNLFAVLGRVMAGLGKLLVKGLSAAHARGLDDDVLQHALLLARAAGMRFVASAERREWAVATLRNDLLDISESTARFAIEMAVQILKAERPS